VDACAYEVTLFYYICYGILVKIGFIGDPGRSPHMELLLCIP
jgi:hypothetical protein